MGDEDSSSSSPSTSSDLEAILEAQKNFTLSAVNMQIQGLESNLLAQIGFGVSNSFRSATNVFKKKGNDFNRKVLKPQEEFCRGKSFGVWEHWQGEGGRSWKKVFPCLITDRR